MMFLYFFIAFQVNEKDSYLFIKYDGSLKSKGLKIFYEIHTKDTTYSDFAILRNNNLKMKIPDNPEFILFFFEDIDGNREPDNDIPYEYVFKGKGNNLKFANYLLNSKTKDFDKIFKYLEKEKKEYPDNKWVRYYEFWATRKKGDKYEITYDDVKDTELYSALKILYLISKNKDYNKEIMEFIKRFPESQYMIDLLSEIDLKYISEISDSIKVWKIKVKPVADYMFYYLLKNFSIKDTLIKKNLLELYSNYEFQDKSIKRTIQIIMFQYFDWEETKKYISFDSVYKMNDVGVNTWYIYYLTQKDKDYKNALKLSLKNLDIYTDDYFEKVYWDKNKEYRDRSKKGDLCEIYFFIAESYYGLNNLKKAKKFIELSIQNETMDVKTPYKLVGDIYYDLKIYDKAEEYYLIYYADVRDSTVLEKLKKIYKGDNFEKYILDGKKSVLRKKMLNLKAKEFEAVDLNGNNIKFSDFKGKVILINFWATWCGPCRKEIPYLNIIFEKFRTNKEVVFIGITDEDKKDVEEFLKKNEYKLNILLGSIKNIYDVYGVPTTILIDKNGFIQFRHVGFGDGMGDDFIREISEEIEFLLE